MTEDHFDSQLKRLSNQWKNSYGEERKLRLWEYLKQIPDRDFTQIVDRAIDTCRSAPLAEDLLKIGQEIREQQTQSRIYAGMGSGNLYDAVRSAEKVNKKADPEYAGACVKLLRSRLSGQITMAEFMEGCDALDQLANAINPPKRRWNGRNDYANQD